MNNKKILITAATSLIVKPVAEQLATESKIWTVSFAGKCQIGWREGIAASVEGHFPGLLQKQADFL